MGNQESSPGLCDTTRSAEVADVHTVDTPPAIDTQKGVVDDPSRLDAVEESDVEERFVEPHKLRFTHDSISWKSRNGNSLDDTIKRLLDGDISPIDFPPLEVVRGMDGTMYSLSNRRLIVFRVLAHTNHALQIPVCIYDLHSERVQRRKYDDRLKFVASKWDRSFSTRCEGRWVNVSSRYWKK